MKRVLIISYYWPPAGGISVLRTLKFVKYLRDFGWEPIVYAPENATYYYYDENNYNDIPEKTTIIRHPIIEPFNAFKFLTGRRRTDDSNPVYAKNKNHFLDNLSIWLRGNFFIPDARYLWIRPSIRFLSKYIKENKIEAILTDGPPHTNTVIGMQLAQKFNIPFLADFQDPWTQVDYYKLMKIGKRADRKHHRLEQKVFQTAKKITIASPTWAKDLENIGASDVEVIYYGYDEDDFTGLNINKNPNEFVIVHPGILGIDRNPDTFLQVLTKIKQENSDFAQKLRLKFAGTVDFTIEQKIAELNLNDNYIALGNIPRKSALQLILSADLLLLPINKANNAKGRLPGKLYEYLRTYNPVLALGPTDCDAAKIIHQAGSGKTFAYDDFNNIYSFVMSIFSDQIKISPDKSYIGSFSNKIQTKKIAQLLDGITK